MSRARWSHAEPTLPAGAPTQLERVGRDGSAAGVETASVTPAVEIIFDAGDRLHPGQLLCGRFRIARQLGRGGMSEVYECTDLELGITVAAKVLRSSIARRPEARDLLRRELLLARRITHPNVCRLFELFVDEGATGNVVIVMELLAGANLAERLRGGGALEPAAGLPILAGVAAGLAAAHQAGVVHRDLKSSNVQLVEGPAGVRPVLTDFGIAKEALDDSLDLSRPPGTPPYMAPEVRQGAPATAAADVFAFGVLAVELLTGEKPSLLSAEGPAAVLRLRGRQVPAGWRRLLAQCLATDPADRPADGAALLRRIERPSHRFTGWRTAAILALALGAGAALVWRLAPPAAVAPLAVESAPLPVPAERVSVVFGGLRSQQPAGGALAASLSQLLETSLAAGDRALVRSSEQVRRVVSLEGSGRSDDNLRRVARALDGDVVVIGELAGGDDVEVTLRIVPADERQAVRTLRRSGRRDDLFALADGLAEDLRRLTGISSPTAEEAAPVTAMRPRTAAAQLLYGEGLVHLARGDYRSSRLAFERALALDGRYALARFGLAQVYLHQGRRPAAAQAAKEALSLAARLPRVQQLAIEALLADAEGDTQKARSVYEALWLLHPSEIDHGMDLAYVQLDSADVDGAEATVAKLRSNDLSGNPLAEARVDLLEAQIAKARLQPERWRQLAEQALARLGPDPFLAPLRARASGEIASALQTAGDLAGARKRLEETLSILERAEAPATVGSMLLGLSITAERQGLDADAERFAQRAIDAFESIGSTSGQSSGYRALARLAARHGELERTERLLAVAIRLAEESDDRLAEQYARNNLALLFTDRGRPAEAAAELERLLAIIRTHEDDLDIGVVLGNLAEIYLVLGKHQEAMRAFEESAQSMSRLELPRARAWQWSYEARLIADTDLARARRLLGDAAKRAGELRFPDMQWQIEVEAATAHMLADVDAAAVTALERAQRVAESTANPRATARVALTRGDLALMQGKAHAGQLLFEQAAAALGQSGAPTTEADLMRGESLLAQGKIAEAERALDAARRSVAPENLALVLPAELLALRIAAARDGRCAGGSAPADELATRARAHGFQRTYFEARLLAARCADEAGEPAAARTLREQVRAEATRTGWLRFAKLARDAAVQ